MRDKVQGEVVRDWSEFGQLFIVEKVIGPRRVGAGLRPFRLWHNGHPAFGGQWHYTVPSALWRAEYILSQTYNGRIRWLENRVSELERIGRERGGEGTYLG